MSATRTLLAAAALLAAVLIGALGPERALALAENARAAFTGAYTTYYFDRSTWNVGCY